MCIRDRAKKVLAFEVTKLVHGEAEAAEAAKAAEALFGGSALDGAVPTTTLTCEDLAAENLSLIHI